MPSDPAVGAASARNGGGWVTTASGAVTSLGGATNYGSVVGKLNHPVVGMAASPDGLGYWLVASDGGIFSYGDARFFGSTGALRLNRPVVGMASSPDGQGYWLVASDGGIFSYGDAQFAGSTGAMRLNRPVVGMASSLDGRGYWLVASDGGIFSFGDARFYGSTGGMQLNKPVSGIAASPGGAGYWLVASDGGVFAFGSAGFLGAGNTAVAAMATIATGGYLLIHPDGTAVQFTVPIADVPPGAVPGVPVSEAQPPAPAPVQVPAPAGSLAAGVLAADTRFLASDQAAGIQTAMLNLSWQTWEPSPGAFDPNAITWARNAVDAYAAAGWTVNVDIGLQDPPAWVLQMPGGRLVDQYGGTSSTADFFFSNSVRAAASAFIGSVVSSLPGIHGYRIGLSENGETLYPDTSTDQWWAFVFAAQSGGADLPAGVGTSPMPGWVPGTPTWNGIVVTAADVQTWYSWYSNASLNAHAWEMGTFRQTGFGGQLQLVMPGTGVLPWLLKERMTNDLRPTPDDPYSTVNTAAIWPQFLDGMSSLANTVLDISSVYDGSGAPRGNSCQAGDSAVGYGDPQVESWSDTRWLTSLATRHGLPVIGENPGFTPLSDLAGTIQLAKQCGLTTLQWAWDDLLQGAGGVTAAQFGAANRA